MWRFESVHGFASVGNLYQKMRFAGSNLSTDRKCPKCIYKISKNFRVEKFLVICRLRQRDIVASDSDIAPLRSAVILYSPPKFAKRIPLGVNRISLRSNRTRRKANITEKSTLARAFFWLGWMDSDHRKCQSQSLVPYRLATAQYFIPVHYNIQHIKMSSAFYQLIYIDFHIKL